MVLNSIYREKPESILLVGDFNDKCIIWEGSHEESELGQQLYDLVIGNNLFQFISEPTHTTEKKSTLLDLIITDSPGYILDSGVGAPIGDPYHCFTYCKFQFQKPKAQKYTRHIWNYGRCNFVTKTFPTGK